jgi:aspartyl/asparaginyl beta-hydroxylase (cupin superfamily)
MAGGNIQPHQDGGDYLDVVRRHHIPIVTSPEVLFFIDGRGINMREGELWEINNMLRHEVQNPSSIDRVHLMVDIIPNEYLG